MSNRHEHEPAREIDLHGLRPEQALRRLEQELHAARVRGERTLRVITGRGWGNRAQKPVLRGHVERWLANEGPTFGVLAARVVAKGGALDVELG